MVERACPVFPWEQYPTGYIITMVTGVGDGSIFIYPVVFLFHIFSPARSLSLFSSRCVVAGARERDPKSSDGLSTVPLRFHGGSSPSRFAPKLRLLVEPRRFPDSFVSSPFFLAFFFLLLLSLWLSLNRSLLRPFPFSFFWRFSRKRWYSRRSTDHGTLIYGRLDPMDKPVDVNWPEKFNRLPI